MTDIQQRAKEIADKHNNDAYSVALAMLEESKVTQDRLLRANQEISRLSLENTFELHRIKADAVREAKAFLIGNGFSHGAPYMLDDLIE